MPLRIIVHTNFRRHPHFLIKHEQVFDAFAFGGEA